MENTWPYVLVAAHSKLLQVSVTYFPSEELWRLPGTTVLRYRTCINSVRVRSFRIGIFSTTFSCEVLHKFYHIRSMRFKALRRSRFHTRSRSRI